MKNDDLKSLDPTHKFSFCDVRLLQREAWVEGNISYDNGVRILQRSTQAKQRSHETAKDIYPLPKIKVPRIVELGPVGYRIGPSGFLEFRYNRASPWIEDSRHETLLAFRSLFENPTEEKEMEE